MLEKGYFTTDHGVIGPWQRFFGCNALGHGRPARALPAMGHHHVIGALVELPEDAALEVERFDDKLLCLGDRGIHLRRW